MSEAEVTVNGSGTERVRWGQDRLATPQQLWRANERGLLAEIVADAPNGIVPAGLVRLALSAAHERGDWPEGQRLRRKLSPAERFEVAAYNRRRSERLAREAARSPEWIETAREVRVE